MQVARNHTAQTLMLANAPQGNLTQSDVITVAGMEGIKVAAAMQEQQHGWAVIPIAASLGSHVVSFRLLNGVVCMQVARNYTAQTLMLANASQGNLSQFEVITVAAMEGIGVAAAMEKQQQTSGIPPHL